MGVIDFVRRRLRSTRVRVLVWLLAIVTSLLLVNLGVLTHLLTQEAEDRVSAELVHERNKFETYVEALRSPDSRSAEQVLRDYITLVVPDDNEAFFSVVDGSPSVRTRNDVGVRLDRDAELVARAGAARSSYVERARFNGNKIDYAVVPLVLQNGRSRGALVIVETGQHERSNLNTTLRTLLATAVASLLLAVVLLWWVAGRMIQPLRQVRRKAEGIDESNLSERVPVVTAGGDELTGLAGTINHMLDRLERSFVSQRAFVDDAAHELRTPLTIIRGHLDLSRPEDGEEEASRRTALEEARRMGRLIDDLLVLASAGTPDFLVEGPVDLADLVTGILARAARLAPRDWYAAGVEDVTIQGDEQRLAQAWMELVTNAVKHTGEGQRIGVGVRRSPGGGVQLFVEDTGPGVPLEDRQRIFGRAFRGHDGDGTRSTGLGLSIVSSIAEAHGGRTSVESGPTGGSRFLIELPITRVVEWREQ